MFIGTGTAWCLLATALVCSADNWRFPGESAAPSVRIDTKVRFIERDDQHNNRYSGAQSDEIPFKQPKETEGFYNRPPGVSKYPVRIEDHHRHGSYQVSERPDFPDRRVYESDGTLDSLQYCKCLSTPECSPRSDSEKACGSEKFLCCYKRQNQVNQQNSEFFNEVEDERPVLLPSRENIARPFPPPPGSEINAGFGPGHAHDVGILGVLDRTEALGGQNGLIRNDRNRRVLVGPDGPTGIIGPAQQNLGVLIGPSGPTGIIGPTNNRRDVGPHGQNIIYPSESAQRGILVGPGGPTGQIGPAFGRRPVLVGPEGPTGIIGPNRHGNRGILVGPGGPTGMIGPGLNRQPRPGYSVRPELNRQVLVGPGGPTGQIGPQYYGN